MYKTQKWVYRLKHLCQQMHIRRDISIWNIKKKHFSACYSWCLALVVDVNECEDLPVECNKSNLDSN